MAHASIKRSAPYRTLSRAFASAKRDRRVTGKRYAAHHTAANRQAYRNAELEWQATGAALGRLTGTHKKRKQTTKLFTKHKRAR